MLYTITMVSVYARIQFCDATSQPVSAASRHQAKGGCSTNSLRYFLDQKVMRTKLRYFWGFGCCKVIDGLKSKRIGQLLVYPATVEAFYCIPQYVRGGRLHGVCNVEPQPALLGWVIKGHQPPHLSFQVRLQIWSVSHDSCWCWVN